MPVDLRNALELSRLASLLRRLAGHLGGDDRATDPARILRLPGTFSFKYDDPRHVALVSETDATVDLSELDALLPREVNRNQMRVLESTITEHTRNDTIYTLIRSLRQKGLPLPAIESSIETLNRDQWASVAATIADGNGSHSQSGPASLTRVGGTSDGHDHASEGRS